MFRSLPLVDLILFTIFPRLFLLLRFIFSPSSKMYILNRLAVGNPPLGLRYLVKSSSFFRVVFRVLNRGLRLNLPGRGGRRAAEGGTGAECGTGVLKEAL